jgi:hypothetical protein
MKKYSVLLASLFVASFLIFYSCKKVNPGPSPEPEPEPTPTEQKGQALFWIGSDIGCGKVTVTVNGTSKDISSFSPNGAPACGIEGAATFDLSPGTYDFTAACTGKTWNGTVIVTSKNCTKYQLTAPTSSKGQAMFWTSSDLGCGNINVTINGVVKTISGFNNSGAPTCGTAGTATFDLEAGSYNYAAQCNGKSWNGTVTVSNGVCSKTQLTGGVSTTGQLLFWTGTDLACGSISVNINGVTRSISSYNSSGAPACGAAGSATFDLAPGSYSYSGQCNGKTWNGTATVSAGTCNKIQLTGGVTTTGMVTFWTASDLACGNITVTCNGVSRTISTYNSGGAPACGANGTATFQLNPGNYTYSAQCSGTTWSGSVTVTANGCFKMQLTAPVINTGQAMFWTASDLGCGNITITCNGVSKVVSGYYSSGAPSCGAANTATFSLNPGTYSYTGRCSNKTWSGNITVTSNGCSKLQLTK